MAFKMTKKRAMAEIMKCKDNPGYFIKNYVKLQHPIQGRIPFNTYPFQDDLLKVYKRERFISILKARQLGISTLTAAYILWLMLFHQDKTIMVIAIKLKTAVNMVKKARKMYDFLPTWMKIANIGNTDNKAEFNFDNGSYVFASTTSSDSGRSEALSLLVVDEAAFVDNMEELWAAMFPTLSTGGRCIALSTPNGAAQWFYDTHTKAERGENSFYPVVLPWTVHPERDEEWFEDVTKNLSDRMVAQEHLCSFNASGDTVINPARLETIEEVEVTQPLFVAGMNGNVWVWEDFNLMHTYVLTADVARGDGEDFSTFHIINLTTGEQVVEYKGQCPPKEFAQIVLEWGVNYGQCMIVVENNKLGHSVCVELLETSYPEVYFSKKGDHTFVHRWEAEGRKDVVPGFTTSPRTRPIIMQKLQDYIHGKRFKVRSSRLLDELKTFVWMNNKEVARKGKNDDLVMAFAIACYIKDSVFAAHEMQEACAKAQLGAMSIRKSSVVNANNVMGIHPTTYNVVLGDSRSSRGNLATMRDYNKYAWVLK